MNRYCGRTQQIFFLLIGMLYLYTSLYARGSKEKEPENRYVQITGIVRLVGSHPFTELLVSNDDGQWFIAGDEAEKLHHLQQRTVTIEGIETVTDLRSINNRLSTIRRELRDVKVIGVRE